MFITCMQVYFYVSLYVNIFVTDFDELDYIILWSVTGLVTTG